MAVLSKRINVSLLIVVILTLALLITTLLNYREKGLSHVNQSGNESETRPEQQTFAPFSRNLNITQSHGSMKTFELTKLGQPFDEDLEAPIQMTINEEDKEGDNEEENEKGNEEEDAGEAMLKKTVITWRIARGRHSRHLGLALSRSVLGLSFRIWSEVIPKIFQERPKVKDVDILIVFATGHHPHCPHPFDGKGDSFAHTLRGVRRSQIHFDDDDVRGNSYSDFLIRVAVHEIGHILGLNHTSNHNSVMYPKYNPNVPVMEINKGDMALVHTVHGHCETRFDTVFDMLLRVAPDKLEYYTYFFRKEHYWLYQNSEERSRPGDPLLTRVHWKGLSGAPDAVVNIIDDNVHTFIFFKGSHLYYFDPVRNAMSEGVPIKLSNIINLLNNSGNKLRNSKTFMSKFENQNTTKNKNVLMIYKRNNSSNIISNDYIKEKNSIKLQSIYNVVSHSSDNSFNTLHYDVKTTSTTTNVPLNVDAAFFDPRDSNLYIYKNGLVHGYRIIGERTGYILDGYPRTIQEEFQPIDSQTQNLPDKLDAVYYSFYHKMVFIIKGFQYWEIVSYEPSDTNRTNLIRGPFLVAEKWPNICATE